VPRWLPNARRRIHRLRRGRGGGRAAPGRTGLGHTATRLAVAGEILVTYKALREAASLGLSPEDVRDVLAGLAAEDSAGRLASQQTREWMYVFKPEVGGQILYVKVVLRGNCVVLSFHEDGGGDHEEDE